MDSSPADLPPAEGQPDTAVSPGWPRWARIAIPALVACTVLLLATGVLLVVQHRSQAASSVEQLRPSGLPPSVPTGVANLMGLSPVPKRPAPGFVLTDQYGRTLPLSSLRGKVLVLEFMDPRCHDICPLVSQEFVDAYHNLSPAVAKKVVFLAVNVNRYHNSVSAVMAFSKEHELLTIPSWRFLTGSVPLLEKVWRAYNIQVAAPNPNGDIIHTSIIYFISSRGTERYVAAPVVDHTAKGVAYLPPAQLTEWGRGIALVASHLAG